MRAIECYVKVDQTQTNDQRVMHKCWMKVNHQMYHDNACSEESV